MTDLELWATFGRAVLDWHQRQPARANEPVMCSCGRPVVLCPYQGLIRRIGLSSATVSPTTEGSAR